VRSAIKAGVAYFGIVFLAGVLLGSLCILALAPALGEMSALAVELPLMLVVSWVVCRRLIARCSVTDAVIPRLAMGGVAFVLLMAAEAAVSILGCERSPEAHLAAYRSMGAQIGLAGQVAFGLLPAVRLLAEPRGAARN
jgi:hypothetical protein